MQSQSKISGIRECGGGRRRLKFVNSTEDVWWPPPQTMRGLIFR